jgi:hypothetical protein
MGGLSPIHDDNDAAYDLMQQPHAAADLMRFGEGCLEDLLLHDIHEEGAGGSGGETFINAAGVSCWNTAHIPTVGFHVVPLPMPLPPMYLFSDKRSN